jgi:hypothetical protein
VNPTEYALEKYRSLHASYTSKQEGLSTDIVGSIRQNFSRATNGGALSQDERSVPQQISIAQRKDFPHLDSATAAMIAQQTKCVLKELHRDQPLAAGEILEPDGEFVTFLLADWYHHSAGTAVVRRRTNQALTYYFLPEWHVVNNTLVRKLLADKHTQAVHTRSQGLVGGSGGSSEGFLDFFSPGADIAKALVWGLPPPASAIGAGVLALLFPPKQPKPIDWEKVYKRFARTIHSENVLQTVEEQTGKLDTQLDLFRLDYTAMKYSEKRPSRQALWDYLKSSPGLGPKVLGVVDTMKQNEFKLHGFGTFMLAATIEILIYQEGAMVDPYNKETPEKSTSVDILKERAATFVKHAEETIPLLIQQAVDHRIALISEVKERTDAVNCTDVPTYGGGPPPVRTGTQRMCDYDHYCYFTNDFDGWQSQKFRPGGSNDPTMQEAARNARSAYISQKRPEYEKNIPDSFAKARQTVEAWKSLQDFPLQRPENRPKADI